jgi:uncharacterized protein (DUF885 family)
MTIKHLAFTALLFIAMTTPTSAADNEDAKLAAFFKAYLEDEFKIHPLDATKLGNHDYDDRIDDLSPKVRAGEKDRVKAVLAKLEKEIDRQKLSPDGKVDFAIFRDQLIKNIWLMENTKPFEEDPRSWNEYITDSVYMMFTQNTGSKERTVRNAASRIAAIPKVVQAAKESLKNPPKAHLQTAIRQNQGAIAFYEKGIFIVSGENPQLSELRTPARALVPVLKEYQTFLEGLLPTANGEWRLGKEKFARKLEMELDAGLGADEVLKEAEAEADRVRRDMYVLARQQWAHFFPNKALPPDDPEGRKSTIQQVLLEIGKNHSKPDNLVADGKATVADLKKFITEKDILRLPDPDRCEVIEMPEFKRGNSTAYLEPAPPLDTKANSIYAISPPPKEWDDRRVTTYLQEYNKAMLKILTIHEAYPGHYVQLEYGNRNPSLIRRVLYSGVYAEGWAVYTEQMMLDQGYGNGDMGLRMNQLKFYLRAVINAILDHKMHCANLTDEEALKLLMDGGFQTEGEAVAKIVRAKQSSCQLSTYFVGRTAFYRLRQRVSRELGDKFELGRYHEAVLSCGTIPVKFVPELTRERLKQPR